jgi:hypothetical protein
MTDLQWTISGLRQDVNPQQDIEMRSNLPLSQRCGDYLLAIREA